MGHLFAGVKRKLTERICGVAGGGHRFRDGNNHIMLKNWQTRKTGVAGKERSASSIPSLFKFKTFPDY